MFTTYSSGSSQDSLHAGIGRRPKFAPRRTRLAMLLVASTLFGAVSLATSGAALAGPCTGPGAPTTTQTKCLTAVQIPGNPLRSYDISWVNPDRAEYYLADRSNAGIDIINTRNLTFKRTLGGPFRRASCSTPLPAPWTMIISGPDGVISHGRWLYAGDGDSTLKVIDLNAPNASALKARSPPAAKRESTKWR